MKMVTKTLGDMNFVEVYSLYAQTEIDLGDTVEYIVDDICQFGYPQDCQEDWDRAKKGLSSWLLAETFTFDEDAVKEYLEMMESLKNSTLTISKKGIEFSVFLDRKKDKDIIDHLSSFTADKQSEEGIQLMRKGMK